VGLSLLATLAVPALTLSHLFPLISSLPKWDQWSMVPIWLSYFRGQPVLPFLFRSYNFHLLIIPKILYFTLGRLTAWDVRVEVIGCHILAFGTLACLLYLLYRIDRRLLILSASVASYVFSISQYENLLTGGPLAQMLQQCAAVLFVVVLSTSQPSRAAFAAATAAAVVATFSWAAGLIVWPLGLLYLVACAGERRRWIAAWFAAGVVCWCLEMAAAGRRPVPSPIRVVRFFLVLLGHPVTWSANSTAPTAAVAGACLLVGFILLAILQLRHATRHDLRLATWLLGILALGEAFLIAIGRAVSPPRQALASHYVTATYPLCLAILIQTTALALSRHDHSHRLRVRRLSLAAIVLLIGIASWPNIRFAQAQLPVLRRWASSWFQADRDLIAGIATDAQIRSTQHPRPDLVWAGMELLSKYRLAAFARVPVHLPLGAVESIAGQQASNQLIVVDGQSPWRIEGWASGSETGEEITSLQTSLDGKLLGTVQLQLERPDVASRYQSPHFGHTGWRVVVADGEAGPPGVKNLRVLVYSRRGDTRLLQNRPITIR
jgi:hypothetical protein